MDRRCRRGLVSVSGRGELAVVVVSLAVVLGALAVRVVLADGPEFLAGLLVGVPIGALLGWSVDQVLKRAVDAYVARIRGR